MRDIIRQMKAELRIPAHFKGRQLFFETLHIFFTAPDTYIVKDVYYELSKKHKLTLSQVENRLHNIIKFLWKNRDLSHYGIIREDACPSNKYFFLQLTSYYLEPED